MELFLERLQRLQSRRSTGNRRWVYILHDQLTDGIGPLSVEDPRRLGLVFVESAWMARRRPCHKQKLALILTNMRQFALEQSARGALVRYETSGRPYGETLRAVAAETGPLVCMVPAERETRRDLKPMVREGLLEILPHDGWLTNGDQFVASQPKGPPYRMDAFYRHVRRETGILMAGTGKPLGGKYSFDAENRKLWKGIPPAPAPPRFPPGPIKTEVGELIESRFDDLPGRLDLDAIPATPVHAETLWKRALEECLGQFGPYEDAMSTHSRGLFHTRISALLNLHRLLPSRVVKDVENADAPLAGREGFIRQVLGWREFVRHVHFATDGFRDLGDGRPRRARRPGDAGYARWAGKRWRRSIGGPDGGAMPDHLGAGEDLPPAYWGTPSGLRCLDTVVRNVWEEAYSHHITRLMILSNIAVLLDVRPRDLADWFWAAYSDAYDWVVEPNVLGIGTYAVGDLMTTEPSVCGAAYINRMSDYCRGCAFDPRRNCPITPLYWAFLDRKKKILAGNHRLKVPLASLKRRSAERRRADRRVFESVRRRLQAGREVTPE